MVALRVLEDKPAESGGGCGDCEAGGGDAPRCGNGLEKVYNTTAVRYGYLKHVGEFTYAEGMKFICGARVVVQSGRGIEMGELVSLSCTGCDKHLSREQIRTYIENSGPESYLLGNGRILREATVDDLAEESRLRSQTKQMRRFAQERANDLQLDMKVVDCEYLLGGDRVTFFFMAEGRVDFRTLVRDLSQEYQTRVKMHQVGARDEARLVADFETCGREVCCKVFLKTLKPITMRMAKLQRSTLDPSKVSGRCGRLKCCLRYEHESYESLDEKLPRVGEKIETAHGFGTVIKRQVLTQLVQIEPVGQGPPVTVVIEDVVARNLHEFPELPVPKPPEREVPPPAPRARPEAPGGPRHRRESPPRPPRATPRPEGRERRDEAAPKGEPSESAQSPQRRRRGRRRRRRPGGGGEPGGTSGNRA